MLARQVAKYREAVLEKDLLQSTLMQMDKALNRAESGLLTGNTAAIAAVDIQNILNALAEQSGVRLKTIRVLTPTADKESIYMPIPVQITFDASIRQAKEILYRIENANKLLRIPAVRIRLLSAKTPDAVQTTMTVEGLMKAADAGERGQINMFSKVWIANLVLVALVVFFSVNAYKIWDEDADAGKEGPIVKTEAQKAAAGRGEKFVKRLMPAESAYDIVADHNLFSPDARGIRAG